VFLDYAKADVADKNGRNKVLLSGDEMIDQSGTTCVGVRVFFAFHYQLKFFTIN
jgi:hypothetical protein